MLDNIIKLNIWNYELLGNTLGGFAVFIVAFFVLLLVFKVFQTFFLLKLEKLAKKTKTDVDDMLVEIINSLRPPFYSFISFYVAAFFLVLIEPVQKAIDVVLILWVVFQVIVTMQILIDYVVRKKVSSDGEGEEGVKGAVAFVSGILKAILWVIGGMLALSNLGIDISSLIAGLGIGGIAIALALQNILGDLFSSFAIHFDKPFRVGDFIVVGDKKGVIVKIGIKTTRLRALQGEEIVISNKELTSAQIQNFKKMEERRASFSFGVTYETPVETLKKISGVVQEIVENIDGTRFDRAHFNRFDDSALNFDVVYYVLSSNYSDYMDIQQEINFKILEAFEKMNVSMAYPTRTIYMQK